MSSRRARRIWAIASWLALFAVSFVPLAGADTQPLDADLPGDERIYYLLVAAAFHQDHTGARTGWIVAIYEETNDVEGLQRGGPDPDQAHVLAHDGAGCSSHTCPPVPVRSFDEYHVVTIQSPVPLL